MPLPAADALTAATPSMSVATMAASRQGLGQGVEPGLGLARGLSPPVSISSGYDYYPQPQAEPQNMKLSGYEDRTSGAGAGAGAGAGGGGGGSGRGVKEGGSMSLLVPVSFEPLGHVKAPGPGLAPGSLLAPGPGLALEHPPSAPLPFSSSFQSTATTTNNNNNTATANVHAYTTTPPTSSSTSSQPASTPAPGLALVPGAAPGLALVPGAALGLALVPCASSTSDGADSYPFGQFNQSQDTHHFSNNNNDNQPPPSQQQQQGMKSIFR